jgi:transposase-like protein
MLRCPVCGSTTIYPVTGGVFGQVYRCKECGYRGSFVLETDGEEGETGSQKAPKKTKSSEEGSDRENPDRSG